MRFYKGMNSKTQKKLSWQSGQVVVEYVLLLAIAVSVAMIIITALIDRGDPTDQASSGAVIQQWHLLQTTIGDDIQN